MLLMKHGWPGHPQGHACGVAAGFPFQCNDGTEIPEPTFVCRWCCELVTASSPAVSPGHL